MKITRRDVLKLAAASAIVSVTGPRSGWGMPGGMDVEPQDRVFIANEDSNTLSVIDPMTNTVESTINLTSFDEDPRPPFRFVTGGVLPTHAAMVHKPLYHGCIDAHGVVPSPDGRFLATCGRGSSNVYLIDTVSRKVVGNISNPQAGPATNPERLSSGIMVGREPHEPTFTRNGRELWIALRGEDRIAIIDAELASGQIGFMDTKMIRGLFPTLNGPAQVWFSKDGRIGFVVSQKTAKVDIIGVNPDEQGFSRPSRITIRDISGQDKAGFTPFQKISPDGTELWLSHKLADAVSSISTKEPFDLISSISLGNMSRPNHLEFIENANGRAVYVSCARVDDNGPGGVASSQIAIIDRSAKAAERKIVKTFFTMGRESHGLWTNPANSLLYVAHEQDELPGTPHAGQTVCAAFDVRDPFNPRFIAQIPLGFLKLPSGELRNKKSINLVYVRPGFKGQTS